MLKKVPKQARSEHMVACILAGATRVLDAVPLAEATTNHIAEVAGVSIGSLYQYFGSKEAIAHCLLHQHLEQTVGLLREIRIASRGCPVEERMRLSFLEVLRDHRSHPMLHLNLTAVTQREDFPPSQLKQVVGRMIDEIALGLAEEHPEADPDEIRVCATLRHQSSMLLAHAALDRRRFGQDSLVMDYFDTLSAAQLSLLDRRPVRRAPQPS